ncbi:MAG TPA: tyrosine--tRNA ligase [Phycisphaerae bacterium]|nr:tyrosine--tRNA ligase [Phycisphaerae bacterium]
MPHDFFAEMNERGLVHQHSAGELEKSLRAGRMTAYIGFDPTADSLHVGSLMQIMTLKRFQLAGHRPIALVGGGTGLIGDPSGKEDERTLLTTDVLEKNLAGISSQIERFLDFGVDGALMVNNADWLCKLDLLTFLRDIGKHFAVNEMIKRDSVRIRLETREHGISYTEFTYVLLQAYDYLKLHDLHGCTLQMGGSDQWGNIVSGTDLIRRVRGVEAHALTSPLMTRSDGKKFGKTEAGNVWLDPARTSPYEFYQFWLNTHDNDVLHYLKVFSFLSLAQIAELDRVTDETPERREAPRVLAEEVTKLVHGPEALLRAKHATQVLFDKNADWRQLSALQLEEAFRGAPPIRLPREALGTEQAALVALLTDAGHYASRAQARKDIPNGSVSVNGVTMTDPGHRISESDVLAGGFVVLKKGKRTFQTLRVDV